MNARYYVEFDNSVISHRSHLFTINLNVSHVVLEDSGDVDFRELVLTEHDQKASLSAGAVAYDNQLLSDSRHCLTICLKIMRGISYQDFSTLGICDTAKDKDCISTHEESRTETN